MAPRIAWVLNLDADLELAAGLRYEPKRSVLSAARRQTGRLAAECLGPGDIVVDASSPPSSARGFRGRAFCPTPRAVRLLERAGAEPEPYPAFEVLRRVNSRAFAAALGPTLPGAAFVTDLAGASAMLRDEPPVGDAWRVKRAFGMAGRGQRVVHAGAVSAQDVAFVRAGIAGGGVQIEPNVAIDCEYALHGLLGVDGARRLGVLVLQRCDARGAWQATERASVVTAHAGTAEALAAEAGRVGDALADAGYFGPFGVDAYVYRDATGHLALQPRSEINARYSMGFATGFGAPWSVAPPP